MFNQLKGKIKTSIEQGTFAKLTISKPRNKSAYLKNVYVRLVEIKGKTNLSFLYRFKTNDQTRNFSIDQGLQEIEILLQRDFRNAVVLTTEMDYSLQITKKEKEMYNEMPPSIRVTPSTDHDRQKEKRAIKQPYLYHLGIQDENGNVIPKMADKYRQINKYLEIFEHQLQKANLPESIHIADMGSGKGYLTFALYDYLKNQKGINVSMVGIELRKELVDFCNDVAKRCDFDDLSFVAERIENYHTKINVLIALHACDTATDDAIYKGLVSEADMIICAPCCHKQIRKQVKGKQKADPILKYGIFEERQLEMVTDAIRALVLEQKAYETQVFEFISSEHTAKNVMLVGIKKDKIVDQNIIADQIKALKAQYRIDEHYLESLIKE